MERKWDRLRDKIGGKWKIPILQVLLMQPQRFNKLKVLLNIQPVVLNRLLTRMETDGLITKEKDLYMITEVGSKAVLIVIEMFELL